MTTKTIRRNWAEVMRAMGNIWWSQTGKKKLTHHSIVEEMIVQGTKPVKKSSKTSRKN